MSKMFRAFGSVCLVMALAAGAMLMPSPAQAYWRGGWHGGWGWGVGVGLGVGLAADAALLGWPGYYGYPYPYGYYPATVPVTVVQPAPAAAPPAVASYYYCTSPQGYYPYVNSCQVPWQQVPAPAAGGR